MDEVARLKAEDRAELFRASSAKLDDLHPVNIEKDFWVTWLLHILFSHSAFRGWLVFKGGTSLSKCFGLIDRFSEDLDLAVDFERLGFSGTRDPRRGDLSKTKRAALLDEMLAACQEWVAGTFRPALQSAIREMLGTEAGWRLRVAEADANTVEFEYPATPGDELPYIRRKVLLELGTHAEPVPRLEESVRPLAATAFPKAFSRAGRAVTVVAAKRTFWEKATILHAEYHRDPKKPMPLRYSRHYSDLAVMAGRTVRQEALADRDLLAAVVRHKEYFYPSGWANYGEAIRDGIRLTPQPGRLDAMRSDYQAMEAMFIGKPLPFHELLDRLQALEQDMNVPSPQV
jgi:hypothetical protein